MGVVLVWCALPASARARARAPTRAVALYSALSSPFICLFLVFSCLPSAALLNPAPSLLLPWLARCAAFSAQLLSCDLICNFSKHSLTNLIGRKHTTPAAARERARPLGDLLWDVILCKSRRGRGRGEERGRHFEWQRLALVRVPPPVALSQSRLPALGAPHSQAVLPGCVSEMGASSPRKRAAAPSARAEKLAQADLAAARSEYILAPPAGITSWLARKLLADPRDACCMLALANFCCLVLPAAVALHLARAPPHWAGALYMALNYAVFLQVGVVACACAAARQQRAARPRGRRANRGAGAQTAAPARRSPLLRNQRSNAALLRSPLPAPHQPTHPNLPSPSASR